MELNTGFCVPARYTCQVYLPGLLTQKRAWVMPVAPPHAHLPVPTSLAESCPLGIRPSTWPGFVETYILGSEKAMAPHSSTLAWKIPWTEEPVRLQSMGLWRVWHDWTTSLSLFTFMHWRRKWQPTPVFLPGESQGRGSLVDCRLWGRTESDTTEATQQQQQQHVLQASWKCVPL